MQEAVFRHPYWEIHDEGVGIWRCATSQSCKQECKRRRKEEDYANGHTYDRT